jgi:hypothetical protein
MKDLMSLLKSSQGHTDEFDSIRIGLGFARNDPLLVIW